MRFSAIAASLTLFLIDSAGAAEPIALHCPRLLDVDAGKLLGETTVVVDGSRIKEVRSGHADISGAQVIELHDVTCLPGLITTRILSVVVPAAFICLRMLVSCAISDF